MYIGGGEFIHSSSWQGGVVIDDVHNGYYAHRYVKAVRVL
jgi:cell wall-associated NlpC family hydrolase